MMTTWLFIGCLCLINVDLLDGSHSGGRSEAWSPWSECSASCGKGVKIRTRVCYLERNASSQRPDCHGRTFQKKICSVRHCGNSSEVVNATLELNSTEQYENRVVVQSQLPLYLINIAKKLAEAEKSDVVDRPNEDLKNHAAKRPLTSELSGPPSKNAAKLSITPGLFGVPSKYALKNHTAKRPITSKLSGVPSKNATKTPITLGLLGVPFKNSPKNYVAKRPMTSEISGVPSKNAAKTPITSGLVGVPSKIALKNHAAKMPITSELSGVPSKNALKTYVAKMPISPGLSGVRPKIEQKNYAAKMPKTSGLSGAPTKNVTTTTPTIKSHDFNEEHPMDKASSLLKRPNTYTSDKENNSTNSNQRPKAQPAYIRPTGPRPTVHFNNTLENDIALQQGLVFTISVCLCYIGILAVYYWTLCTRKNVLPEDPARTNERADLMNAIRHNEKGVAEVNQQKKLDDEKYKAKVPSTNKGSNRTLNQSGVGGDKSQPAKAVNTTNPGSAVQGKTSNRDIKSENNNSVNSSAASKSNSWNQNPSVLHGLISAATPLAAITSANQATEAPAEQVWLLSADEMEEGPTTSPDDLSVVPLITVHSDHSDTQTVTLEELSEK